MGLTGHRHNARHLSWNSPFSRCKNPIRQLIFFNVIFIFERERERERARKGQREGDRGSKAGSELTAESPMRGLNPWTTRSWPELRSSQTLNWLSHPGAPTRQLLLLLSSSSSSSSPFYSWVHWGSKRLSNLLRIPQLGWGEEPDLSTDASPVPAVASAWWPWVGTKQRGKTVFTQL